MLETLTGDINKSMGSSLSQEVEKMLELFSTNSESIDSNFTSLRQKIEDLEQNVIATIK